MEADMQALNDPSRELMIGVDTAVSETAVTLRKSVRSAIDPPNTSRRVRRSSLKHELFLTAREFLREQPAPAASERLYASAPWAAAFIDGLAADGRDPEVGVDSDGDILFEWLNGPRDVVTVAVGPNGIINFASITSSGRFHGVTRIGGSASAPLDALLSQATTARFY